MDAAGVRAQLVEPDESGDSVLTTIPRSEVEEALRAEGDPPDLILDVTRYAGDGEAQTSATGSVPVSLSREVLEEILRRSEGDGVTIAFDADGLLRAFEGEVEAHGLREAAAVLAVAVAAGSAAGVAAAQPAEGAGTSAQPGVVQSDYGMPRAMPGDYAAQPGEYGAPRAMPSDYAAQPGEYGAPRAMPSDYAAQPGEYGAPRAMPADYEAQPGEYGMPRAMPADYEGQPGEYGMPRAMPADYEAQPAPDGGIHVTLPSPAATGAIAGAFALIITGAAFAFRGRRRVGTA